MSLGEQLERGLPSNFKEICIIFKYSKRKDFSDSIYFYRNIFLYVRSYCVLNSLKIEPNCSKLLTSLYEVSDKPVFIYSS